MSNLEKLFNDSFESLSPIDRFLAVRSASEKIEVSDGLLPRQVIVEMRDDRESKRLFDTALGIWNSGFKISEFENILKNVVEGSAPYNLEVHQKLKTTRIGGVILRDASRLFLIEHKNPESFYILTKILGQFNDNYGTQTRTPSASNVLVAMNNYQDDCVYYKYTFASKESTDDFISDEIGLIVKYLSSGKLYREEFHDLRKTNRRILNIFLLRAVTDLDNFSFDVYTYLRKVNTTLGTMLEGPELELDSQNINQEQLVVPEESKHQLVQFLSKIF